MKPKLIAVVGPTGAGKSDFSLDIAETLSAVGIRAEMVNSDSMQFYRGMDIGTAKLPIAERRGFHHHLLDWLKVTDESTAAEYQVAARKVIEEIQSRDVVPILVGGSMLYIAAVLNTFEFPARDPELREQLEELLTELGPNEMHRKLAQLDAGAASKIDPLNGRRIVRAIEIVSVTGKPFSAALPEKTESWQPVLELGLNSERAHLVSRLQLRAKNMFELGLVEEARSLIEFGIREGKTASQAIGYRQALGVVDRTMTEAEAIEETALLTARYARRQMSWFRRDERIRWFDYQSSSKLDEAFDLVKAHLED